MWSMKKNLTVLAVLVGAVVSAWGADVAPFSFEGIETASQQAYWDHMIKFKLWGTNGIEFAGTDDKFGDNVGWTGTADGNLSAGSRFMLGGPIIVGGTINVTGDDNSFATGPVRATYFNSGARGKYAGQYCIDSTANENASSGISGNGGNLRTGDDALTGACDTSIVPAVYADLEVPLLSGSHTYSGVVKTSNNSGYQNAYIDVPPGEGPYDIYLDTINIAQETHLYVRMPENGRLTRIFPQSMSVGNHGSITVMYVGEESVFNYTTGKYQSVVDAHVVSNADYAGNLLFYIPHNFTLGSGDGVSVQGTFICKGTMNLSNHTKFAGQLIADYLKIPQGFAADDFRFVPFDPPLVSLNMAVDQQLSETHAANYAGDILAIELTKAPTTDVTFKYCFNFDGVLPTGSARAMLEDVEIDSISLPLCKNELGKKDSAYATIKKGNLSPQDPIKIWIFDDDLQENTESFQLKIWDLEGGTFSDNSREWPVRFFINDNDHGDPIVPKCPTNLVFEGNEDEEVVIGSGKGFFTLVDSASGNIIEDYRLTIRSVSKGNLNYEIGSSLSSNDLYYGRLKFQGAQNEYGNTYATIGFDVSVGSQSATGCSMVINLNAVNDPPSATGFDTTITENNAKGIKIGQVKANDVEGSKLYYKITYGNVNDVFRIDASGNFYVDSVLDYEYFAEGHNVYPMVVMVCDDEIQENETSSGLCTSVSVNVTVANENEPPKIKVLNGTIDENAIKGTDVHSSGDSAQVFASDPEDAYNKLKYEIVSGNTNNAFVLDNEGYFVVNGTIDYETTPSYSIKVKVSDTQGLWDTATVVITVNDINEPPSATGFTVSVDENVVPSDPIGKVNVNDQDHNEAHNYCFWLGEGNCVTSVDEDLFSINGSGEVSMLKAVDYETDPTSYEFVVLVTDKGDLTDTAMVSISINDVNETPTARDATGTVNENSDVGKYITYVVADDAEDGFDGLTYTIVESAAKTLFSVSNNKDSVGFIKVAGVINYEQLMASSSSTKDICKEDSQGRYCAFTVRVTDKGGKTADSKVKIYVEDVNERPAATGFVASLDENKTTSVTLGTVGVKDEDENETHLYSFLGGYDADGMFTVDNSGVIRAVKPADYEALDAGHKFYDLVVLVKDKNGAEGYLDDTAHVRININNVNEAPSAKNVVASVKENASIGKTVEFVYAEDPDDAVTALKYEIVEAEAQKYFTIVNSSNPDSVGAIKVNGSIDYESLGAEKTIQFTIRVTDKGGLSATATATITIEDVNEAPVAKGFHAALDENEVPTNPLGKVEVTDVDAGDVMNYSFFSGNVDDMFAVDQNGNITVVKAADYEDINSFELTVLVKDSGELTDTAIVVVSIKDVNEAPTTSDKVFEIKENMPSGTVVGTVPVKDVDKKEEFRKNQFAFADGDTAFFKINATTGEITTKKALDYEENATYKLKVRVYDPDGNEAFSEVTVNIKDVKETSVLVITHAETESGDKSWDYPKEVLYVNEKSMILQWTADDVQMPDTLVENLHEGLNTITIAYTDPKKDEGTSVQLVVFVSTTTPQVVISTVTEEQEEGNIFTIKEERAENDTTAYVNQKDAQISITVKEPILDATYTDSTCKWNTKTTSVKTDLDIIDVPASTFTAMNSVVEEGVYLNENPSTPATHTPYNGDQVKVTYTEKVAGKEVQVSYVTDEKGNPVKETVVDLNGNVETIEVITVSYETKVGNQTVTISYTADAATGQPVLAKGTAAYNEVIAAQTSGNKNGGQSGNTSGSGTSAGTGDKSYPSGSGTSAGTGDKSNPSGTGTSAGTGNKDNTSGNGTNSENAPSNVIDLGAIFTVSYDYTTKAKNGSETTVQVSYVVDKSGKVVKDVDGNIGYTVSFTYENEMGNASTESVFVIVDVIPPKVKILSPAPDTVLYSNYVDVKWTVDYGDGRGPIVQDTLNNQGLEKGVNAIVRFYMDKAGNVASDTVFVVMKNAKDVDIKVETPITTVTTKDVEEHYAKNEPEKGQTFSVSVYSPKLGKEVETQVGGEFKTKEGSGDEPYPGVEGHLGPTLSIETKLPVISAVTGLATLDDLIGKDGLVNLDGVDAANSEKVSLDDYVLGFTNAKGEQVEYCTEEFREDYRAAKGDLSRLNMYTTTMSMKIWVYTSLGQFVDYFTFTQEMDDPDLVSDAGVLKLYFEQKPDKNGDLRTKEGRVYATGAYIYKTEVSLKTTLRCSLPPVNDASNAANRKNAKRKVTENMLKTFGYKRPSEDK